MSLTLTASMLCSTLRLELDGKANQKKGKGDCFHSYQGRACAVCACAIRAVLGPKISAGSEVHLIQAMMTPVTKKNLELLSEARTGGENTLYRLMHCQWTQNST